MKTWLRSLRERWTWYRYHRSIRKSIRSVSQLERANAEFLRVFESIKGKPS